MTAEKKKTSYNWIQFYFYVGPNIKQGPKTKTTQCVVVPGKYEELCVWYYNLEHFGLFSDMNFDYN